MRLLNLNIFSIFNNHLVDYPTPININYFWGFGSLSGICLGIQIISGLFLSMHYTPHIDLAFLSVEHIVRDVNNGWLLRYIHSNGASMFFIVMYIHIGRGLYFNSFIYPRRLLWITGVIIFLLTVITAFLGYVLPWGQMSFWGSTVITNLTSAIPIIGMDIATWLWGGYSIGNATLNRFFSLHYLLPFILVGIFFLHLNLLHTSGSSNPINICSNIDKVGFYPYFIYKDLFGFFIFLIFFSFFLFFFPNYLGHPDNYIQANCLVTPPKIVPEWYLLCFYAILRSIPNKLLGVLAMLAAILVFVVLPFIYSSPFSNPNMKPFFKFFYWLFVSNFIFLSWLGAQVVEDPYIVLGQLSTFLYFSILIFFFPLTSKIDKEIYKSL